MLSALTAYQIVATIYFVRGIVASSAGACSAVQSICAHVNAGVVVVALAVLHAGALLFWLYLLARSGNLPATAAPAVKKFKNFSVTYDFDSEPKGSPVPQSIPNNLAFGPAKRNRSVLSFGL